VGHFEINATAPALCAGRVKASDLVDELLERIDAIDGQLGAFVAVDKSGARLAARNVDAEIAAGNWRGPLHGIPFAAKDMLATVDLPTEVGMKVLRGRMAGYDATAVLRLREAGGILIGKLTQTEGTFGGYHPEARVPKNPWDPSIWPGASSSGPGVAVAARLCSLALASDTGGSIRAPSAACGVTGLMPSLGRVSGYGAYPFAPSLDRIGPMATSAIGCAHALRAIAGRDSRDPSTIDEAVPDYAAALGQELAGLRLGFDDRATDDIDPEIGRAMADALFCFERAGIRIVRCRLPETRAALEGWVSIAAAGAAAAHRESYIGNEQLFGRDLAELIELGLGVDDAELSRAISLQGELRAAMTAIHGDVDAMLVPVSLKQTPSVASFAQRQPIWEAYPENGRFTGTYNLTGQPTITFPAGFTVKGLPIGLQLAGAINDEQTLLHLAHRFQQATDWHLRMPELN